MKTKLGWAAHVGFFVACFAAIWIPIGARWQWITTAFVLLFLGALLLGSSNRPKPEPAPAPTKAPQPRRDRPTYGRPRDDQ